MAFIPGLSVPGTEGLDTSLKESKCKCRSSQVFKGLSPELLIKCHFDHNLAIETNHKYKNKENRLYPLMERHINRDSRNCWQQISYRKPQRNFPQDSIWGLILHVPVRRYPPSQTVHCLSSSCTQTLLPRLLSFIQHSELIPFPLEVRRLVPDHCDMGPRFDSSPLVPFPLLLCMTLHSKFGQITQLQLQLTHYSW